jgi:hypothetical protein
VVDSLRGSLKLYVGPHVLALAVLKALDPFELFSRTCVAHKSLSGPCRIFEVQGLEMHWPLLSSIYHLSILYTDLYRMILFLLAYRLLQSNQ